MTRLRQPIWERLLRRVVDAEQADEISGDIAEGARPAWRTVASVAWAQACERVRNRTTRGGRLMIPGLREFQLALRRWKARPGLAASAVVTLALGLGATTAMFSVVDSVVVRQLPWPDADRLVNVYVARPHWQHDPVLSASWRNGNLSWPIFRDVLSSSTSLEAFGVWRSDSLTLAGAQAELVRAMLVSADLLPMLGVTPARGRFFTDEEDVDTSDSVIVSYETWQLRYGGAPDIIGTAVSLNEQSYRIVGVLPPRFRFGIVDRPEFLRPVGQIAQSQRTVGNHFLNGIGRLKSGVNLEAATAELDPWIRGESTPETKAALLVPHVDDEIGDSRRPLYTIFAAAGLLLLIAASNVGVLLMGDAQTRRHEFAVRAALGGGRRQVWRQLLAEAMVLAVVAAIGAVLLAVWALPVLIEMAPRAIPRMDTVTVDLRVLAFALAATLIVAVGFGSMPSLALAGTDPADALRAGGRGGAMDTSRGFRWIVAGQVALALVLVMGAGLLVETVRRKANVPLGFDAERLAVTSLRLVPVPGASAPQRAARTQHLVDTLSALPGVQFAAATSTAPFSNSGGISSFEIPGRKFEQDPNANRHIVTEHYFATMGMRAIKGRVFMPADQPGAFVAVVTEEFERAFMDGEALGKHFTLNGDSFIIIGVVGAPKHRRYVEEAWRGFYLLSRQLPTWSTPMLMVRAERDPAALLPAIRQAISDQEPGVAFVSTQTMEDMLGRSIAEERYRAQLSGVFGGLALVLSAVGLYAVVARAVQARTRELGVRLALGATPADVSGLVLRHAIGLAGLGALVGVPVAMFASRAIAAFLYDVSPQSPLVLGAAISAVLVATLAASLWPAIRAARIDPLRALRD